jgi:hypothetical protein
MMNTCSKCGEYRVDKTINTDGPYGVYPVCGQRNKFKQLPLYIITGAKGVGKSTVCRELQMYYQMQL